jgi:hypothetical protein
MHDLIVEVDTMGPGDSAVFAERLAVIGSYSHAGEVGQAKAVEVSQDLTYRRVHVDNLTPVQGLSAAHV